MNTNFIHQGVGYITDFSLNDLKKMLDLHVLTCYAEERLSGYQYLELVGELDIVEEQHASLLDYFALRKLLNPINSVRFILLSLLSILDFSLRLVANALIGLSYIGLYIATMPLRILSDELAIGLGRLLMLPAMLCSWAFHSGVNAVRIILEHVLSPVNSFIKTWYDLKEPRMAVVAVYAGLTLATLGAILLTAGAAVPLGLMIGGALFAPLMIHAGYKIGRQAGVALLAAFFLTFEGSYSERYSFRIDHTNATYHSLGKILKPKAQENSDTFNKAEKKATIALFNSHKQVRIEPSRGRSNWDTAASFFKGWEPLDAPIQMTEMTEESIQSEESSLHDSTGEGVEPSNGMSLT